MNQCHETNIGKKLVNDADTINHQHGYQNHYYHHGKQQHQSHHFDIETVIRSLENAFADDSTTKLIHYIDAFAELKKLFSHLGLVFSFVEADLHSKHGILADLVAKDPNNYMSIEQMVFYECFESYDQKEEKTTHKYDSEKQQTDSDNINNNLTEKKNPTATIIPNLSNGNSSIRMKPKAAGSRTLLRLHRALAFLMRFIELIRKPSSDSTSILFRTAYNETLSRHHTWLIRTSVQYASAMVPSRDQLIQIIFGTAVATHFHVRKQEENGSIENSQNSNQSHGQGHLFHSHHQQQNQRLQEQIDEMAERFLHAIRTAYERVEAFYSRHGLLDLP